MGKLINLAVYNPAILDDEDFLQGFVARRDLTERLLNRLREITPKGQAKHLLLSGQRGMGKTSMLRRLALGVASDSELAALLLPLSFREEQYNVHNLHAFWCNCLDALGDYLEKTDEQPRADQLDAEIAKLPATGDPEGSAACALFKEWCGSTGKRPLLLLDNIDLVLGGLKEQQQWSLRRLLQERGGVVVVGASATVMEDTVKIDAPFYDFFQVHQLEKLSHPELLSCLRQIAIKRGEAGEKVVKVLDSDPGRIHALYDLTGGNPRTLVLLYLLLEIDADGDVMDDLERLLDQVTALYKARVEDLAPQTRVVLDAVALAWNPVTVAQIANETGLETGTISSQFDRLIKMGILERVSLSTPAPSGYQLGERFFNIWYLMRNASRRMRNRLRWLTEFLRRLYTPQQLNALADDYIQRSKTKARCSSVYGLALADALEDNSKRHSINHLLTRRFKEEPKELRDELEKLIDQSELDQNTLTMAELKDKVLNCRRDWGKTTAQEFWDLFAGSLFFPVSVKYVVMKDIENIELNLIDSLVLTDNHYNKNLKKELQLSEEVDLLREAIRDGFMSSPSDFQHAIEASKIYGSPLILLIMLVVAQDDSLIGKQMGEQFIPAINELISTSDHLINSNGYYHLGRVLAANGYPSESEQILQKSIELDQNNPNPWNGLGNLYQEEFERYPESEMAFRRAIELKPSAIFWNNLGSLLAEKLERYEEAETAFRNAIKLDPTYPDAWKNLGIILREHSRHFDEAEAALRKVIELEPADSYAWSQLGFLLTSKLNRHDEARDAYNKAIELDENNAVAWINLGNLLSSYYMQHEKAEKAYRMACSIKPNEFGFWGLLGILQHSYLQKYEEAVTAYRKAISLGDKTGLLKKYLTYLLYAMPERLAEADAAYAEIGEQVKGNQINWLAAHSALAHDNFGEAWQCLLKVLEQNLEAVYSKATDGLIHFFRLAKTRGYGERLLAALCESGMKERHWPLYAAFDAYLHGKEKLRDVNPEVRGAAQKLYDWLAAGEKKAAAAPPKRAAKRTRKSMK